jgi:hypothetical protein
LLALQDPLSATALAITGIFGIYKPYFSVYVIRYPFTGAKNETLLFLKNRSTYKKAEKLLYFIDFDE